MSNIEELNEILAVRFGRRLYRDKRLRPTPYLIVPRKEHIQLNKILILVLSKISNSKERNIWRRLYGSSRNKQKFGYTTIFSTGTSSESDLTNQLITEAEKYGDILQADFDDSYRTLTLKMMSAIRYISIAAREVKAVLKVDDDISWRIRNVTEYINSEVNAKSATFHCYRHESGRSPPRKESRKW
ncbi:N-acetyllactosaminide 3-alpha-galactosyltransferase [Oesophagostomum dentatum]|uniref:Hexosyltransferase n=1 Tax=Oesophagostomum dentatum TaxID=61180 RepID=A0A0B1T2U7_OESDE|nr:N-acetyllactosaminide 3-alpha-galactosyltransferase [Oesophagostomum dentatum]